MLGILLSFGLSSEAFAQRKRKPVPPPASVTLPLTCTPANIASNEKMTYLVGASMTAEEKARIKGKWGTLTVPLGETERAKEIHANALAYQNLSTDKFNKIYDAWVTNFPKATAKEKKKWRVMIDDAIENTKHKRFYQERLLLKKFDWREQQLKIGAVMNQGEGCNTCWAFAATDAATASLDKNYQDVSNSIHHHFDPLKPGIKMAVVGPVMFWTTAPFVQDLLNCMPIKKEEMCNSGWHGTAFDFMVYKKGIPLANKDGFTDQDPRTGKTITYKNEYKAGAKFSCKPNGGYLKAAAWDYVNSPPDQMPTVAQLKETLIAHGPIVTPIFYDQCLANYRSGVFNEKDAGMVNHVVLLIGWDDKKQAWLVKNSWGEEWGEKGFGWIKYGSNNIGVFAAWIEADWEAR
jgi:hypothetical protein